MTSASPSPAAQPGRPEPAGTTPQSSETPVTSAQYLPPEPGQPVPFPNLGRFEPGAHGGFQHPPEKRSVLVLASVGQLIGLVVTLAVVALVIYLLVR